MPKTSKKARKFLSKGGPKGMLEKGTITKKGKLKVKKRGTNNTADDEAREAVRREALENERLKKREEEDFVGKSNLGDLDMDTFLQSMADSDQDNHDDDDDDGSMDDTSIHNDDSDDDNDNQMSDDDDDDPEAAEQRMKAEMDKLAENDPDFHKYLKENESSLLQFGEDNHNEVMEEEPMNEQQQTKKTTTTTTSGKTTFTAKILDSYIQGAFEEHKTKSLKNILSAFKSACQMGDPNEVASEQSGKFHIDSSIVFDRLMVVCLRQCHEEFHYHLLGKGASIVSTTTETKEEEEVVELDENKPFNPRQLAKSIRWTKLKPLLNSLLKSILYLLEQAKDTNLQTFILKSLSKYVPYLVAFPRVLKGFLRTLTSLWSATNDTSPDYQVVRLNAFLRIRQLAVTQPFPFIEQCLKATYLAYAKRAKFANAATVTSLLPTLTFMGNCVVELYSLDYASSYQHAFVYIRQLALHLRTALQKKTPEAFRVVHCWQYIHCLKLWTAVLSSACSPNPDEIVSKAQEDENQLMKSLVYPLTEIILGVARLNPTSRNLPLRLHCVRLLHQLAACTEHFIPTTSILLDALTLKEIMMKPKKVQSRGSNVRGVRLPLILKLPKENTLRTAEQLDACLGEIFVLLNREVDLYRYSVCIPEFTIIICQKLRKFAKESKNGKYRAYAKGCIELCEKHSKAAITARSLLKESPKDVKRLEALKPNNGALSMKERYEASVSKENRLEAATQPVLSEKAKQKALQEQKEAEKKKNTKKRTTVSDSNVNNKKKKAKMSVEESTDEPEKIKDEVTEGIDWSDEEEIEEEYDNGSSEESDSESD